MGVCRRCGGVVKLPGRGYCSAKCRRKPRSVCIQCGGECVKRERQFCSAQCFFGANSMEKTGKEDGQEDSQAHAFGVDEADRQCVLECEEMGENEESGATAEELLSLIVSQKYRCALSGLRLDADTASIDHKIPRSKGGTNHISNLQWLHHSVNRMKGSMSTSEFLTLCKLVSQHASISVCYKKP